MSDDFSRVAWQFNKSNGIPLLSSLMVSPTHRPMTSGKCSITVLVTREPRFRHHRTVKAGLEPPH